MMNLQEIINSINSLPTEERDYLFEFLRQQEIENRRVEILANAQEVTQAFKDGTAKKESVDDLSADLLEEQETDSQEFWDELQESRRTIEREGIIFTDEDFADLRDRSVSREIDL